jgi:hypothetical protein
VGPHDKVLHPGLQHEVMYGYFGKVHRAGGEAFPTVHTDVETVVRAYVE